MSMRTPYDNAYNHVLACAGLEKQANMFTKGMSALGDSFRRIGDLGDQIKNFRGYNQQLRHHKGVVNAIDESIANNKKAMKSGIGQIDNTGEVIDPHLTNNRLNARKHEVHGRMGDLRQARNQQAWDYAKSVAPAVGVTGAGIGASAYALGDADTWQNQMYNYSNDMFGTNFSTQSRLGRLFS